MQRDIKLVWFRRWFVLAVRNAVHRHRWHEDVLFDEAKKSISMQRSIITGVLEPILEETVFRGFLMVSLTMWFSTPVCVLITAVVFAFAHLTPEEFPQLFVLGRCGTGILIFSNSESSHSYHNSCCLEFWSNIVANRSSAAGI